MLQAWRNAGIITYCGYILGFPGDTPESIRRDIEIIKRELPVDMLEFFILTPLPGSEDHRFLYASGTWMDPDMNLYDLEHVTTGHATMSKEELQGIYREAWNIYYTREHIETLLRRAVVSGIHPVRLIGMVFQFYGSLHYEKVHPLQGGFLRRKVRTQRRYGLPHENPLIFYPRRAWELTSTYVPGFLYYLKLRRMQKRIQGDPATSRYMDTALTPVADSDGEALEMFEVTESARAAVAKAAAARSRSARAASKVANAETRTIGSG